MRYSNATNIPPAVAVFLATDNYDYDPNTISATALLKPIRQLILSKRVPPEQAVVDIAAMVKSRIGSAIHDAIEHAWVNNHKKAFKSLGYNDAFIDRIVVNPNEILPNEIPVYLEQRLHKKLGGYTIGGKFDIVLDGQVQDYKSTGVFTLINGVKDDDYIMQGSIYRWLDPELITKETMQINFILTDWSSARALNDPSYPQSPCPAKTFPLKSLEETEMFIQHKLKQIEIYKDAPEEDIPLCTDKELWRSEPEYKYYKDKTKMLRATKNFSSYEEAMQRYVADGSVGVVVTKPGQVTACKYCAAFAVCKQKDALIDAGELIL